MDQYTWDMEQGRVEMDRRSRQIEARNIAFHAAYNKAIGEGYGVGEAEKIASEAVNNVLNGVKNAPAVVDIEFDSEYVYQRPTTRWHLHFTDRQFARLLVLKSNIESYKGNY